MKGNARLRLRAAMPMTLALLVTACAHSSSDLPPPVAPPVIPALPQAARQPTPPEICSETCSFGLTALRKDLLDMLTKPAPQDVPASGPMTH